MPETFFDGGDMARVIIALRPELGDGWGEHHSAAVRRITEILAHPERPVSLRAADVVVTAMGCPHVLTNGAVRLVQHNRLWSTPSPSRDVNSENPGVLLPAPPFRKWLERQSRHYRTLTAMYHDLSLTPKVGSNIWLGYAKSVHSHVVEVALDRRGVKIELVYPTYARSIDRLTAQG
jgi:hypothetical protein